MRGLTQRLAGMPPQFGAAFGFVGAPVEVVTSALMAWHDELGFAPRRNDLDGGLLDTATALLPLSRTPYARSLLVGTRSSEWTALFDARLDGGDPRSAVSVLGRRLQAPTVVVYAVPFGDEPEAIPNVAGTLQWEYSPDGSRSALRSVALVDGESPSGLRFEVWGPVQPWESTDLYVRAKRRERLTAEVVEQYCRVVDVDPFDLTYYVGPSVLVERTA